mmetsp:Transcript_28120/g.65335  ORF Transcript_28120/g.65335 Transcript_28120/m.65335 type:complete len:1268 (+) Transcript_28120:118-3921(+)
MFGSSRRNRWQVFRPEEVARHNTSDSLWIAVDDQVYDVTDYAAQHPGGAAVLRQMGGREATAAFQAAHKTSKPRTAMKSLLIGSIDRPLYPETMSSGRGASSSSNVVGSIPRQRPAVEAVAGGSGDASSSQEEDSGDHDVDRIPSNGSSNPGSHQSHQEENSGEELDHEELDGQGDLNMSEGRGAVDAAMAEQGQDLADEVVVDSFNELRLREDIIHAMKDVWRLFLSTSGTQEAAGEAIYAALFEGAPSLQSLFITPRAVQAMRFMTGLHSFVNNLEDPPQLKVLVETLSFGHLHLDVTVSRVAMFRDAILDLFSVELADRFDTIAYEGWKAMLNYIGGAIIYVKAHYADRIKILQESWLACRDKGKSQDGSGVVSMDKTYNGTSQAVEVQDKETTSGFFKKGTAWLGHHANQEGSHSSAEQKGAQGNGQSQQQHVPTNYPDMFRFNAVVMGFANRKWFNEVLACFNDLVMNVSNSIRFQEECDVLTLRISKVAAKGSVNYAEYKSCMLASLRSLLPKEWSTAHEVAWTWLWENVEHLLKKHQGQPPTWERALTKAYAGIDDAQRFELRKDIYGRFFQECPAGQNFFKQSNTYLHIIADKIMEMVLEMYREPVKLVDDISSLGLRHVGYGIPTEHFGPFVSACVLVLQTYVPDPTTLEAFRWSLALVSRMLVRTIREGSTIVMKAINTNSMKQLKKAISCSPRGDRAMWCLVVQVGTQSISPLSWAIQSGRLEAAGTILNDLLTIRADRDSYYYGVDDLFMRHPDIVQMLCQHAPKLLSVLFDGLIWRSRVTEQGLRRVNYFVKHLLVDADGNFAQTFRWVADFGDPKIVCHPVLVLLSDTVWSNVAYLTFLYGKSWYLFTLLVFLTSQSILAHTGTDFDKSQESRTTIFVCRCFVYGCSMLRYVFVHTSKFFHAYRQRDTLKIIGIPFPKYLENWQEVTSLLLTLSLITMLALEPIVHCLGKTADDDLFGEECQAGKDVDIPYSIMSMTTVFLYYLLLIDFAAISNRVSAFVLLCSQMLPELLLFLLALGGLVMAFGSAASILTKSVPDFEDLHEAYLSLLRMSLNLYAEDSYDEMQKEPVVFVLALAFLVATAIFLVNMLIAQLTCAYGSIYVDMGGYARLSRIEVIVETMPLVPPRRWKRFLESLKLDRKMEFNSGDVGLAGGVQVREPASANPTTVDMIRRFGGSTSPTMQWPEEADDRDDDEAARFDRMEKVVQKTLKKITRATSSKHGGKSGSDGSSVHSSGSMKSGTESQTGEGTGLLD